MFLFYISIHYYVSIFKSLTQKEGVFVKSLTAMCMCAYGNVALKQVNRLRCGFIYFKADFVVVVVRHCFVKIGSAVFWRLGVGFF